MKKGSVLALLALMAVFTFSACGEDEKGASGNSEFTADAGEGKGSGIENETPEKEEQGSLTANDASGEDEKSDALAGYDANISSDIFFRQVERVGDDVILVWKNRADEQVDGVQVLRAEVGSNQYQVVAVLGKEAITNDWKDSYMDSGAGADGKTYQYVIRNVSGDSYGKSSEPRTAEDTRYKWYKGTDGYICCRPWENGSADFTQFSPDFEVMWNCDWQYWETEDHTYELTMLWEDYDGRDWVRVTEDRFCFVDDEGVVRSSYSAINQIPLSIGE